ncbi:MAG: hypothetical protein ACAH80_07750 [Alphaproteobacteria bacterium]
MSRIEEFKDEVDLYSADLSRWPQDKVKPALDLMKANPVAKAYFDDALKLDEKLRDYGAKPVNVDALATRIMAEMQKAPAQTAQPFKFNPAYLFAPGGGLLAAALIGFVIGFYPQAQTDFLLDPVYYSQEQGTTTDSGMDAAISEEDIF